VIRIELKAEGSVALFDFLKSKKVQDRFALSLDIGTEFVKALIFKIEEDKGVVLGVGRQRQKLTDMQGGMVTDIGGVIKNSQIAINRASEQAGILPEQVIIGIAGELVKGNTTTIRYSRPEPKEKISLKELRDIIARVQRKSFDRARAILSYETGYNEIDVKLVNAAIVDVRIDGYKVNNPLDFQGREIQIGVFNAFAPDVHLAALQTIAENLDLDLLSIAAEPYAVAQCIGGQEVADFSAIFIDIGGGTTDIAIVQAGGLEGTKMFALGGRAFTKRISNILGCSFSEAEEIKIDYSHDKIKDERSKIIKKAMLADAEVWLRGVELTLQEFTTVDLLPSRILLCGGGSALPEISEVLKEPGWSQKLPFGKKPSVHFLHPKDVTNIIDRTESLEEPADVTPMALANLALDLVGEEEVVEGILSKVVAGLRT
jgi:cell division protein FtsA